MDAEAGAQRSTPLQLAARHGQLRALQAQHHSQSVHVVSISIASRHGQLRALQALLEAGAASGARNARGSTALALAAQHGHAAATRALLLHVKAGAANPANPANMANTANTANTVDGAGNAPLHLAAGQGHAEVVTALAEGGAAVSAPNARGSTPLHLACGQGGAEAVRALVAAGADVEASDGQGGTPLHLASWRGDGQTVEVLCAAGVDVDRSTAVGGVAALHIAAAGGHAAAVRALLTAGAAVRVVDGRGRTARGAAEAAGHAEVMLMLVRAERDELRRGRRGVVCAGVHGGGGWLVAGGVLPALSGVARLGRGYSARWRFVLGAAVAVAGWWLVAMCGE